MLGARTGWTRLTCGAIVLAALVGAAEGCSPSHRTGVVGTSTPDAASGVIGPEGGTVATSDGAASVTIPSCALTEKTTITIDRTVGAPAPSGGTAAGTTYTFGPEGLALAKDATITLAFDPAKVPAGTADSSVVVFTAPAGGGVFSQLAAKTVDATHRSADTPHFSMFVVGVAPAALADGGGVLDSGGGGIDSGGGGIDSGGGGIDSGGGGIDSGGGGIDSGGGGVDSAAPFVTCMPDPSMNTAFHCGKPNQKCWFQTSCAYTGAQVGSLAEADAKCQAHADAAALGGTYKAWLSGGGVSASGRVTHPTVPYVNVNGHIIVTSYATLVDDGTLNAPGSGGEPNRIESGAILGDFVWTATDTAGNAAGTDCTKWTSNAGTGQVGQSNFVDGGRYISMGPAQSCAVPAHLYCLEQ